MPKGTFGCFACGQPTELTVQAWLRDYCGGDGHKHHKQKTMASIARSFCGDCGLVHYGVLQRLVVRRHRGAFGCAICGDVTLCRVQIWMRRTVDKRSVCSTSASFCEECSLDTWGHATQLLDGDTYRESRVSVGGDMSGARKRQNA